MKNLLAVYEGFYDDSYCTDEAIAASGGEVEAVRDYAAELLNVEISVTDAEKIVEVHKNFCERMHTVTDDYYKEVVLKLED